MNKKGRRMKAIVTLIDDNGEVIETDKILAPTEEYIDLPPDGIATKTTTFMFKYKKLLSQEKLDVGYKNHIE